MRFLTLTGLTVAGAGLLGFELSQFLAGLADALNTSPSLVHAAAGLGAIPLALAGMAAGPLAHHHPRRAAILMVISLVAGFTSIASGYMLGAPGMSGWCGIL